MQLYIPNIGERITLAADWTFRLFNERRCQPFDDCPAPAQIVDNPTYFLSQVKHCTLPAGTVLLVDRVYLRQGLDEFASISFRIVSTAAPWVAKQRKRFWAKLDDVNQMQIVPPAFSQRELTISLRPDDIVARARQSRALTPLDQLKIASAAEGSALAREARGLVLELEALTAALRVQVYHTAAGTNLAPVEALLADIQRLRIELNTRVGLLERGATLAAA
jgi:hypothetical protein